jgi:hypothetical protein
VGCRAAASDAEGARAKWCPTGVSPGKRGVHLVLARAESLRCPALPHTNHRVGARYLDLLQPSC